MKYAFAFSLAISLLIAALAPAQDRPTGKKSNTVVLYFPNDRTVRGEVLSMTGLSVSIYVDGKLETFNPALQKILAVQTQEGWQIFNVEKKRFVAATVDEVQKVLGKTVVKPMPIEKPASRTSGPVQLVNTNKETIRIVTKTYVDGQGQKRVLVRTIDVKPGHSDFVEDLDGKAIHAAQISFTLITKNGSSEVSAGMREFDGTSIQVVVSGDKVMTASGIRDDQEKSIVAEMLNARKYLDGEYLQGWLKSNNRDDLRGGIANPEFRRSPETAKVYGVFFLIGVLVSHQYADYFRGLGDTDREIAWIPAGVWKNAAGGIRRFLTRDFLEELFPNQDNETYARVVKALAMIADNNSKIADYLKIPDKDKRQEALSKILAEIDPNLPTVIGLLQFCDDFAQANRARKQPSDQRLLKPSK